MPTPSPLSQPFVEEARRSEWDRGCLDWPLEIQPLEIQVEKSQGDLRVRTRLVFHPEKGESSEELLTSIEKFLTDEASYGQWVLPGINEKPGGGRYFVLLEGLRSSFEQQTRHHILRGDYQFKLLWFERTGTTSLLFRDEVMRLPDCPAFDKNAGADRTVRHLIFRMIPREDLLQRFVAEIWVYPIRGGQVEVRMRIASKPSTLVYELMPEGLAASQLRERGRRIFENFLDFRRAWALEKLKRSHEDFERKASPFPGLLPGKKGL